MNKLADFSLRLESYLELNGVSFSCRYCLTVSGKTFEVNITHQFELPTFIFCNKSNKKKNPIAVCSAFTMAQWCSLNLSVFVGKRHQIIKKLMCFLKFIICVKFHYVCDVKSLWLAHRLSKMVIERSVCLYCSYIVIPFSSPPLRFSWRHLKIQPVFCCHVCVTAGCSCMFDFWKEMQHYTRLPDWLLEVY